MEINKIGDAGAIELGMMLKINKTLMDVCA
jgi:hypothetical protein